MADKPDPTEDDGASGDAARKDDKTVPLAALEAEREKRQALERQVAELSGKIDGMASRKEPEPAKEPPVFTRAQLKQAVADGRISEAEMDVILDKQQDDKVRREAAVAAANMVATTTTAAAVESEIGRFKTAIPDLANKSSDAFKAVAAKFNRLVSLGSPNSVATELAALEAVFGDPAKLQKAKVEPETHEDVGGSAGGSDSGPKRDGGKLKDFTPREKAYYQRLIDQGTVKSWDEARGMLKHATPELRQRNADRIYRRA